MDVRTEQAYQQRIAALELQNASLESRGTDLTRQLAQRDAQLAQRDATVAALQQQVVELSKQVADLLAQVARLSKNSSNSSKPPSSDIVKPPLPPMPPGQKRAIGGQPGHQRHERSPFTPAQVHRVVDHKINRCPDCGAAVRPTDLSPRKVQQVDLPEAPVQVVEHRCHGYFCPHCRRIHYAPLPKEVHNAGLVGPRLTALIAYIKGPCHCSFSTVRNFCRDVLQLSISRGQLAKVIQKASTALAESHVTLQNMLPGQKILNVDESGHRENGHRFWTWAFRAASFTCFKVESSRGSQVLLATLGEDFAGILSCDYFSAYHKYRKHSGVALQFCLAHLIRDVKFLATLPEPATVAYGQRLLDRSSTLFCT